MRPLISLITAAAVLLHLGLGCCAHHTHASAGNECVIPASLADAAADHGHTHGHDHSVPDSNAPECPSDSHDGCHESHCSFLVTGKTTIALDTLVTALTPSTLDTVFPQAGTSSSTDWVSDTGDHLRLPVRLHLLNQVLLI